LDNEDEKNASQVCRDWKSSCHHLQTLQRRALQFALDYFFLQLDSSKNPREAAELKKVHDTLLILRKPIRSSSIVEFRKDIPEILTRATLNLNQLKRDKKDDPFAHLHLYLSINHLIEAIALRREAEVLLPGHAVNSPNTLKNLKIILKKALDKDLFIEVERCIEKLHLLCSPNEACQFLMYRVDDLIKEKKVEKVWEIIRHLKPNLKTRILIYLEEALARNKISILQTARAINHILVRLCEHNPEKARYYVRLYTDKNLKEHAGAFVERWIELLRSEKAKHAAEFPGKTLTVFPLNS
jgi:hypothetical protein